MIAVNRRQSPSIAVNRRQSPIQRIHICSKYPNFMLIARLVAPYMAAQRKSSKNRLPVLARTSRRRAPTNFAGAE
jgi:hypothetical protein